MKSKIITYQELFENPENFGGKSKGIHWLLAHNFLVPKGCIIPAHIQYITTEDIDTIINQTNSVGPWIFRSSAENEDGEILSFAGLYKTLVCKDISCIGNIVSEMRIWSQQNVIEQYAKYHNIVPGKLHIIIQEYIAGNISGVFFSDLFGKGPLIEYVSGGCDRLVNGTCNATQLWLHSKDQILRTDYDTDIFGLELQNELIIKCMDIHTLYGIGVDIEWTILGNQIYFLQIRPITQLKRRYHIIGND